MSFLSAEGRNAVALTCSFRVCGLSRLLYLAAIFSSSHGSISATVECFARQPWVSVCPSFCPSHCSIVLKRRKLWSRNLHCGWHGDSSFVCQTFMPLDEGVPLEQGREIGVPLLKVLMLSRVKKLLQIGTGMLLIITITGDKLFRVININDLKRPWTFRIKGIIKCFAILECDTHFKSELRQNG